MLRAPRRRIWQWPVALLMRRRHPAISFRERVAQYGWRAWGSHRNLSVLSLEWLGGWGGQGRKEEACG